MRTKTILALFLLSLAACGGGDGDADSPDGGDAHVDAGSSPVDAGVTPGCTCVALGSDFAAGVGTLSTVELPSLTVTQNRLPGTISSDPVVRYLADEIYVVNRFGADNVTIVDPATWLVRSQFSTGAGSNPQDIAVVGAKGYVVTFAAPEVQIWDVSATDPTEPLGTIDLAALDPDGNPDAATIIAVGGRAYVALELLDDTFLPSAVGKIALLDVEDDAYLQAFDLSYKNPFGFFRARGMDLLVPTVEDVVNAPGGAGCLEMVTPDADNPTAGTCLAENSALGGYVTRSESTDELTTFVAVAPSFTEGKLMRIDANGAVTTLSASTQVVTDLAYCAATGQLLYNDVSSSGLRVLDADRGDEVTTDALDLGEPPVFQNGIVCF